MEAAEHARTHGVIAAAVQSLRRVRFFATLWTEARQSSVLHYLPEFAQTQVH